MLYNPNKSTWLNSNIEYLFNNDITEFDIKDAGINIIQEYKLLDQQTINNLLNLPKLDRHIAIGKLQSKDKNFSLALMNKFAEIRNIFININKLEDNIISVKKDAIYTFKKCDRTKFGKIEFIPKNVYTSYIRFSDNMNIEIYYSNDKLDIKGIGDHSLNKHRLYLLEFLKKIISYLESKDSSIKRYIKNFIMDYKFMKLDDAYYLEFNNLSKDFNPIYNYQKLLIPLIQIILKEIN